jgi:microcystin degradation protein MlrC
MRFAIGAIIQESNSFVPARCTLDMFRADYLLYGDEVIQGLRGTRTEVAGILNACEEVGVTPVPLLAAHSCSYGPLTDECYGHLKAEMFKRLAAALPVDGIVVAMHGAMLVEGEEDPEGDLIATMRRIAGPVPIGVSLDLHAHVTARMVEGAAVLVGYSRYPHDDAFETGQRACRLIADTVRGKIRPAMVMAKAPMIVAANRGGTNGEGPFARIMREAKALEATGQALSASCFPVQPWLDVPGLGFTGLVITDGDAEAARRHARTLAHRGWELRHEFQPELVSPAEAIRRGLAVPGGPVLLVDTADCQGGGATGDSVATLEALLAAGVRERSLTMVADAEAVRAAQQAGVGSEVSTALGNRIDQSRGQPLPVRGRIRVLSDGRFQYSGGLLGGVWSTMGPSAVLAIGGIEVLVHSNPTYEYADEQYRSVGLDVRTAKFVTVKNPMNYQLAYQGIMKAAYILDTPGPTTPNLKSLAFTRLRRPYFPLDEEIPGLAPTIPQ